MWVRLTVVALTLLLGLSIVRCVSRTVPEERFHESQSAGGLAVQVPLADPENFSFAIVGDLHIAGRDTSRFRRILDEAIKEGDAFIAVLGDIVDKGDRQDVEAFRAALAGVGWEKRALPVIGNHDIFEDGWSSYRELNGPSHYTADIGNSRFIAIDTADGTVSPSEAEWLNAELAKPHGRHRFLLSHYLPVVPGQRTYLKLANEAEALRLMRLATTHEITGWLGGHYHSFISEEIEGVKYVVAGGAGGRRMEPVKDYFFVQVRVAGPEVSYHLRTIP